MGAKLPGVIGAGTIGNAIARIMGASGHDFAAGGIGAAAQQAAQRGFFGHINRNHGND